MSFEKVSPNSSSWSVGASNSAEYSVVPVSTSYSDVSSSSASFTATNSPNDINANADFSDESKWTISTTSGLAEFVGNKLVLTSFKGTLDQITSNVVEGETYSYELSVSEISGEGLCVIQLGNVPYIWANALGAGVFSGTATALTSEGIHIACAFNSNTAVIDYIRVANVIYTFWS